MSDTHGLFDRVVTHDMARQAFKRYHHALYCNESKPALHVPVDASDADVVLGDYIRQQEHREAEVQALREALQQVNSQSQNCLMQNQRHNNH